MTTLQTRREWLLSDSPVSRGQARWGQSYRVWLALKANRLAMVGLWIVIILTLLAIFAPLIAPYDPLEGIGGLRGARLEPPSRAHPLGTDDLSRDILSRILYGSRLTLPVVLLVAVIATPIGLAVGTTAGYFGGWVDVVLMRITDIFMAFPRLILALAFASALGPGIENAIIAIAITAWPPYAHELSGGMGQRAMIAMMLFTEPDLLIADEPTSALDVTVQIEVLRILDRLVSDRGMGLIFISHDLRLVSSFCDRVLVMYAGRVVEELKASQLAEAKHPYTQGLFKCLPRIEGGVRPLPTLQRDAEWAR